MCSLGGIGNLLKEVLGCWDMIWDLGDHVIQIGEVTARVDLEQGHASGCIWSIVACKFGSSEVEVPIILTIASECSQHVFEGSVCSFGLTICLWVECSGHCESGSKGLEEGSPKLAGELGISVRDY